MGFLFALALALQEDPPQEKPAEPLLKTLARQVTIDGQMRLRVEYRNPVDYGAAISEDDDLYLSRIRVNLKWSATPDLDVFVQPQDQRTFGDEASVASDETNLDLHQGWVEVRRLGLEGLSAKLGRQELQYGDQRLVSPLDWSNIGRAWDGARLRWQSEGFWAEAFAAVIREAPAAAPPFSGAGAEDDQDFFGLYASWVPVADHEFDVYAFGRMFRTTSFVDELGTRGDLKDATVGLRLKGKASAADYSLEAALQRGTLASGDVKAAAVAATLGGSPPMDGKPRVGIEVTWASGDDDPLDGDEGTFDPLFPFQHFYQGYADQVGWRNSLDVAFSARASPCEAVTLQADVHVFRLAEERDAWHGAAGTVVRMDATGASGRDLGFEVDVHARVAWGREVKFWGGVSYFKPGEFADKTGRDDGMTWVFLQMTVEF